jgi:hypothetical protein
LRVQRAAHILQTTRVFVEVVSTYWIGGSCGIRVQVVAAYTDLTLEDLGLSRVADQSGFRRLLGHGACKRPSLPVQEVLYLAVVRERLSQDAPQLASRRHHPLPLLSHRRLYCLTPQPLDHLCPSARPHAASVLPYAGRGSRAGLGTVGGWGNGEG